MVSEQEIVDIIEKDIASGKKYWDGAPLTEYEEVAQVVEDYLDDEELHQGEPDIMWAPLSQTHWELVAFAPGYQIAVIDSVYASPEVAREIMGNYPVGLMELDSE